MYDIMYDIIYDIIYGTHCASLSRPHTPLLHTHHCSTHTILYLVFTQNTHDARSKPSSYRQPWSTEEQVGVVCIRLCGFVAMFPPPSLLPPSSLPLPPPLPQARFEELLRIYPPEAVERRRFEKISKALGSRTTQQVRGGGAQCRAPVRKQHHSAKVHRYKHHSAKVHRYKLIMHNRTLTDAYLLLVKAILNFYTVIILFFLLLVLCDLHLAQSAGSSSLLV